MNYYNEIDPYCAQWLRNLIAANLIPQGHVDQRDIRDVTPNDLKSYIQCHFFAGLGGWPLALQLAAIPPDRPLWTGSCPCQPFSAAGSRRGFADERHLWPYWHYLIEQCRPPVVLGEQVAKATDWLRLVRGDLEALDYAVGAMPIEAASAGAFHLRDRYWFVAHARCELGRTVRPASATDQSSPLVHDQRCRADGAVAHCASERRDGRDVTGTASTAAGDGAETRERWPSRIFEPARRDTDSLHLANPFGERRCSGGAERQNATDANSPSEVDWIECAGERSAGTTGVEHPTSVRWREGRPEHEVRSGRDTAAESGVPGSNLGHTDVFSGRLPDIQPPGQQPEHDFYPQEHPRIDWIECADGKVRPVESSFRSLVNGVWCGLDELCAGYAAQAAKEVAAYVETCTAGPGEILPLVRAAAQPEALQRETGVHGEFCPPEVLLAFLRDFASALDRASDNSGVPEASGFDEAGCLRSVRIGDIDLGAPRQWRSDGQRAEQPADLVSALSRILARHAMAYWQIAQQADAKSTPLLSTGVVQRVAKLRALGNAIVPQVAAEFIKAAL